MIAPSVLFLVRALDVGGAQRQLVELAGGLHRAGWLVMVVTFYGGAALEAPLKQAGVPVVCLNKRGRWDVLPFLWRLAQVIRRHRPHIVHGSIDMCNVLLALLRPFMGNARVVWSLAASNMDLSYYDWLSRIEFRLGILLSRVPDLIVCNSEAGRAYHIARGYRSDCMVVIPNGIDVERFKPDDVARRNLRADWGISANEHVIGLVGRLDPMKDHSNFLQAAAQVAAVRPDTRFVCVGHGPMAYRHQLFSLAAKLGISTRLIWVGERTDIWRVYNALDLAVSSSLSEGLPNVIAEAMATGVPCVVTDVGDCATLVGDTGWVCAPSDSAALSRAILRALNALPCDPFPLRQRICEYYSAAALLQRTAEQFSNLIAANNLVRLQGAETARVPPLPTGDGGERTRRADC